MSYLVFARKFRPQTFDEVIGQEPITTTLKNAISKNRIAQSFLFTGSRGVDEIRNLRDAESLLDQLASFGEGEIKETDVTFSLGLTDDELFFSIIEALQKKDSKAVLAAIQTVSEEGKDLNQFVKGLLDVFRNLLVLKVAEQTEGLIEATEAISNSRKTGSARAFSFDDVCRVWPELVERVKTAKMSCGTYLSEALPIDCLSKTRAKSNNLRGSS